MQLQKVRKITPGNKIKLSVCMMVKNEEEMLPQCLESFHDFADEIIIVDTGSEDRTVEIAESYGAKVYHHPWENNFSKHRNQSIAYATGDWILQIDADEEVNRENFSPNKMKTELSKLSSTVHAVLATISDYNNEGKLCVQFKFPRLFRNDIGVRYKGEVHNQVVYEGDVRDSDLELFHYGYDLSPQKMEAKFQRTTGLLKKRIEKNPKDYDAYFYLANSYAMQGEYEQALDYAIRCFEYLPEHEQDSKLYLSNYYTISSLHANLGNLEEAQYWADQGLERNEHDIGLRYILGAVQIQKQEYDNARLTIDKYLSSYDLIREDPSVMGSQFIYNSSRQSYDTVHYWLLSIAIHSEETGDIERLWDVLQDRIYGEKKWQAELLHNLAATDNGTLLIEKTTELLNIYPNDITLLNALVKFILNCPESHSIINEFLDASSSFTQQEDYVEFLYKELLKSDVSHALEVIRTFGVEDISQVDFGLHLVQKFYLQGEENTALRLCSALLEKHESDQNLLAEAIRFFYKTQNFDRLLTTLPNLLDSITDYRNISADLLLITLKTLLETDQVDHIVPLAQALEEKIQLGYKQTITSLASLAGYFYAAGEWFLEHGNNFEMQMAMEIAYELSGDLQILEDMANALFESGQYQTSIKYYNNLIQNDCLKPDLLSKMQAAFDHIDAR